MFTWLNKQTVESDLGFILQFTGRFSAVYKARKTVSHELHRLNVSAFSSGVFGALASQETKAAFEFAERASTYIRGN